MTAQQKALTLTCVAVFLLLAAPRARVGPGGIPIYLYDVFGALAFGFAYRVSLPSAPAIRLLRSLLAALLFLIVISQVNAGILITSPTNAAYMAIRYFVNVLMAVAILKFAADRNGFDLLTKTIIAATAVTATITLLLSVPATRDLILPLMKVPFLNPTAMWVDRTLASSQSAVRGESLIGTSTITGAFLASMWPIVACMPFLRVDPRSAWNRLRGPIAALVALGALATYSRGALLALGAACVVLLVKGSRRTRQASAALILAAGFTFYFAPSESESLMIDRYSNRFSALAEGLRAGGEFDTANEADRLESYIAPFIYLSENPEMAVLGHGNARGRTTRLHPSPVTFPTHALIPSAMVKFGLVSALILVSMIVLAIRSLPQASPNESERSRQARASVLAMFAAASIWFIVGHAAISTARGFGLTMTMIALAHGVALHLRQGPSAARPKNGSRRL
ncbi:O-antigen ligase family protein [Planctomycetota bacterium]|nr:O-antigen ligase family protein [Planctomycetota bacterium]